MIYHLYNSKELIHSNLGKSVYLGDDITIVYCITIDKEEVISRQLHRDQKRICYHYLSDKWKNKYKINVFRKVLKKVATKYVLIVDALDVCLRRTDLSNLKDKYDIFFMRQKIYSYRAKYMLNSGIIFGNTKALQFMFQDLYDKRDYITDCVREYHVLREGDQLRITEYMARFGHLYKWGIDDRDEYFSTLK